MSLRTGCSEEAEKVPSAVVRSGRYPSGTTHAFVHGLKDLIVRHRSAGHHFTTLSTLRLGAIPPSAAFPILSIVPKSLSFGQTFSSGHYDCEHGFEFEIWTRQARADHSLEQANALYDELEQFLDEHWDVGGLGYNIEFGEVRKNEPSYSAEKFFIHSITAPARFRSREVRPPVLPYIKFEYHKQQTLSEFVFSCVKENLTSAFDFKINFFSGAPIPPSPSFPAVTLMEESKDRTREPAGSDSDKRIFSISVLNAITPHEDSIDLNLKLTDNVVRMLFENRYWSGIAVNSNPTSVSYGAAAYPVGDSDMYLYGSTVSFEIWTRRKLPNY